MNARRACIPGIQKMAGEIFVDPWPQSDSDIWLSMFTEAKAVNMNLCSYLFLVRGCGTYLQAYSSYELTVADCRICLCLVYLLIYGPPRMYFRK